MDCRCTFVWLIAIATTFFLALYAYLKSCFNYWKEKGVDYLEPHFFYGNIKKMATRELAFGEMFHELYKVFKARGLKHGGYYFFFKPSYMPIDPELIKCIMQKDFNHFVNHGMYVNEKADPLTGHLFNLEDAKWRNLRTKLTPTFTSGKMKMMFQTLVECSYGLEELLNEHAVINDPVDIKEILARFTTDVIGSCAFGLDCNSLKNPNSEFRKYQKKIFQSGFVRRMRGRIMTLLPRSILIAIGWKQTNPEVEAFFIKIVKDMVEYREKNNVYRKDFMHLLLQLKNRGKITDDESIKEHAESKGLNETDSILTVNEIAAQCFVFFLAGYETSATTMTYALYELAENQEVQQRLRDEIMSVLKKHDNTLTYEAIMEMTYMEKVINETLRMHPPLPGTVRVCNKSYNVPGTDVVIEPGTRVHIPIMGLQYDPEYYPNPETFDPERFSEENKAKRPAFTFLPFGEGPRICIGSRFGMMQSKVGLSLIISKYRVTVSKKTQTPLTLDTGAFLSAAKGGVWLEVCRLDQACDKNSK